MQYKTLKGKNKNLYKWNVNECYRTELVSYELTDTSFTECATFTQL